MNALPTFAREKIKISLADIACYALGMFFFLLAVLMYTYPSIQTVQVFYRTQLNLADENHFKEVQSRLVLEYEKLISPDRMKERALKMGYGELDADRVVYIRKVR